MKIDIAVQFRRDVKLSEKRGKNIEKLWVAVRLLASGQTLPASCKDHSLIGNWKGWRDCYIEPDWLLLYKKTPDILRLERTGRHQDLFDNF